MSKVHGGRTKLEHRQGRGFVRCGIALLLGVAASTLFADDAAGSGKVSWPGKTGPNGDGSVDPRSVDEIPVAWDESGGEGIAWKSPIEPYGHSTPVVGEGRVWFTSANDDGTEQYVDCFDLQSGERLHRELLFENADPEPLGNTVNNYAAPTPVLEAGAVYIHFGTYGTARLDPETAEVVWQRRDIHARHFRGPGSSPLLFDDLLVLTFDGIDRQFVTALDKATGETVWTTERSTDYGDLDASGQPKLEGDLRKAYSTAAVAEVDGRPQIVSVGAKAAFGYDARTGEEIWTVTHDGYNAAPQPLIHGSIAVLHTGAGRDTMLAVRLDASTRGDVTETHVVWRRERGNPRMAFPVLAGDRVVWVTDTGIVTAIDVETGDQVWAQRLGGNYMASPLVAGTRVYFFSSDGEAVVLDTADDDPDVLSRNVIGDGMTASPAAAPNGLILRTGSHLVKVTGE